MYALLSLPVLDCLLLFLIFVLFFLDAGTFNGNCYHSKVAYVDHIFANKVKTGDVFLFSPMEFSVLPDALLILCVDFKTHI